MLAMSLFIESDTIRECPAMSCHVGGSFGLLANFLAVLINSLELSNICWPDFTIGRCASRA